MWWRAIILQESFLTWIFPRTPAAQTAASKWLRGLSWKGILLSMRWPNIFLFQRAVFRQCDWIKSCGVGMWWRAIDAQECFLTSMFPPTLPARTTAAIWLRGFKWKEILFSIADKILYNFNEPFFGNVSLNKVSSCENYRFRMLPNYDVSKNVKCKIRCGQIAV